MADDESGPSRVFRIPHLFQNIMMHLEIPDWENCENVCQLWKDFVLDLYSKASLRYVIWRYPQKCIDNVISGCQICFFSI